MTNIIAKFGIAAIVALTGLSTAAPMASAAGPDLGIYVQYHDRDRDRDWRQDRGRPGRDRDWRPDRGPGGCSPRLAEDKADRMGLRRTRVVDVSRRTVTVAGFGRHGPDRGGIRKRSRLPAYPPAKTEA